MNAVRVTSFLSMIICLTFFNHTLSGEYTTITGNPFTVSAMVLSTGLYECLKPRLPQLAEYMDSPRALLETAGFILNQQYIGSCINPTIALTNFMVNLGTRTVVRFFEERKYIEKENIVKRENGELLYLRSPIKEAFKIVGPQAAAYLVTMALVGC